MKIEHIKVNNWDVAEAVKEINKRVEGRELISLFFNKQSLISGTLEIKTEQIKNPNFENKVFVRHNLTKESKYRGVSWDKGFQKWRVRIMVKGQRISLGLYDDEFEAAKVYDLQALKSLGRKAKTNLKWEVEYQYDSITCMYHEIYQVKGGNF